MKKVYDYRDILNAVKTVAPEAHIAGGAVRDTLLERPIRDIDIFLDNDNADEAAKLLRSQCAYVKVGEWKQYEGFSDPAMERVAKFEKWDETIPVCVIALKEYTSIEDNIGRFDFGICMAAWDGERTIAEMGFKLDRDEKTFTMHRADNYEQFCYSMTRFKKLTADRYVGWTLAVPAEFEELAKKYSFERSWYIEYSGVELGYSPQTLKPKEREWSGILARNN